MGKAMGSLLDFAPYADPPSALIAYNSTSNIPARSTTSPRAATTPLEKHIDPAKLAQVLFGDGG